GRSSGLRPEPEGRGRQAALMTEVLRAARWTRGCFSLWQKRFQEKARTKNVCAVSVAAQSKVVVPSFG
ncbi:hypothetical protein, partial [Rhodococcus erythropolis]|uniref:hypothetical protein n=1 Tax=Rhodococcus erythropolis TaxID=1833 RepID=UPI002225F38F